MNEAKHTPGPWRWEVNPKAYRVQLLGGVPKFDCTVIDFARWGFNQAAPRFVEEFRPHMNIMKPVMDFAKVCPGREHHQDWFRIISHPDADLIAAAPDLLAACKLRVALWDDVTQPGAACEGCSDPEDVAMARAAIAKAEGAQ